MNYGNKYSIKIDQKNIFLSGSDYLFLIENFKKVIQFNMKSLFSEESSFIAKELFPFCNDNEIIIFLKNKIYIIDREFYDCTR